MAQSFAPQMSMAPSESPEDVSGQVNYGAAPGPALKQGDNKSGSIIHHLSHIGVLTLFPWLMLTVVMIPFALFYQHHYVLAWILFTIALLISLLWMYLSSNPGGRPNFLKFLGLMCLLATGLGCGLGFYDYYKYTYPYQVYENARWYTDVRPSENPAAKQDAGTITFSSSAFVDYTKGLGYQDSETRTCVAPIIGIASDSFVGYWAVGEGTCCRRRGRFLCGDVLNTEAKSGLVLRKAGLHDPGLEQYKKAADQAGTVYGYTVPDEPIFVHWTADPSTERDQLHEDATDFYWQTVLISLPVIIVLAIFVHFGPTRPRVTRKSLA